MHFPQFDIQKERTLSGIDLSRKGSVDSPVRELVACINEQKNYFTTSSCSGRILLFQNHGNNECHPVKKKGCHWLFTSHDCIKTSELVASLDGITGKAVFKFEPFILHVQCRTLEDAQKLHSVAIASGLRNSGISIGGKGKVIAAIRSTHMLEVPLSCNGEILVSEKYLNFLVDCANNKMNENSHRIDRFFQNFIKMTQSPVSNKATTLNTSSTGDKYSKTRQKRFNMQSTNRDFNTDVDISSSNNVDNAEEEEETAVLVAQTSQLSVNVVHNHLEQSSCDSVDSIEDTVSQCFFLSDNT
ncbi:tRNA wybutosine-synthesizing protein 3 homolog isoform X1 [Gigantopelta aegis]|uniref:tRNA wybutosine-synthesizing protein 3 homolog isoform X1 n=1 Tax=Gigantopelta aegis TaxID=1735272 RepID=UPI001B88C074|nr:tRNA wybutosine-synthesizing protein 3 homolog isoform X1 [Gigantopelta aegis]